jgi:hypothetical protein
MIEVDQATIVAGLPKHGKTTIARADAVTFLRTYPTGLVLAHDLNEELVEGICVPYENTAKWRDAYRAAAAKGEPFARGASFRCEASEIGELVLELGRKHNRAKDVKVPLKYIKDEESNSDTSVPTYQGGQDRTIWSNRRHLGCAPLVNVQVVTDLNVKFWRAATHVYLFCQTEENARHLEKTLSLPKHALDPVVNAPKYRYLLWRQGEGLVQS